MTVYVNPAAVVKDKALDYEMAVGVELEMALRFPVDVRVLNYVPSYFAYHASPMRGHICGMFWGWDS
ncbi:hypothetical protein [Desulforudis sp. DRI-14]|uniref:hypothetical protein n=1 Tax=Desulforudis sp. DRI-14 TaxID=3459793 RepID=UPI004042FC56